MSPEFNDEIGSNVVKSKSSETPSALFTEALASAKLVPTLFSTTVWIRVVIGFITEEPAGAFNAVLLGKPVSILIPPVAIIA